MNRLLDRITALETLNFFATNRIPRRWLTKWVGRISKSEHPLVARASLGIWRAFAEIDLRDSDAQQFPSMHACFTRKLRAGARPIDMDPSVLVSPCDAILGASGAIDGLTLIQAKQQTYSLNELLGDDAIAHTFRDGCYATLRLTSGMYHRFHAPHDCEVTRVTYFSGDAWNVNPPALSRIAKLFCQNERAVLQMRLASHHMIALVPVAAILVASIRLHFLDVLLHLNYEGPHVLEASAQMEKGEEMGWFEHGSTIIVLAPSGVRMVEGLSSGSLIRVGQPLMRLAVS
jgi:phosphatidylserine decarboxylase